MNLQLDFNKNEFVKFVKKQKWDFKDKTEDNPDVVITNRHILLKDSYIIFKILDVFKVQLSAIAFKTFKVSRDGITQLDKYPDYQCAIGDVKRFNANLEYTGLSMYKYNMHVLLFTDGKQYIGIIDYLVNIILGLDCNKGLTLKISSLGGQNSPVAIYCQNNLTGLVMPYKLDEEDIKYLKAPL